ncbi:MAG TPA: type II secretion system protein [Candidatus Saccharimonadales bacterium]
MFTLNKQRDQRGFTIVELLIVIVVIGILAALVITTYGGIQAKGRDSQRQSDIKILHSQIELFYADHNFYPAVADLNNATWRTANMKGLDIEAMVDPSAADGDSDLSSTAASSTNKNVYGYVATGCSGTAEPDTGSTDQCTGYTLSTYLEAAKKVETKTALE